jgi:murein DD-endopeptidase MepM/ murein hydrolase activator NlpD
MSSTPFSALPAAAIEAARTADAADAPRTEAKRLAQEFEALLITQMLRDMRQALVDEPESDEQGGVDFGALVGTIDAEFGRALAASGGFGMGQVLLGGIERAAAPSAAPGGAVGVHGSSPLGLPSQDVAAPSAGLADRLAPRAVSSPFGQRTDPFTGGVGFHHGVDIRMAYGEEVRAVGDGRVRLAGEHGGYGNMVAIVHEDGRETRYAHLSEIGVREGDRVQAGQVLGRSGSSGRATGPHLHFEVVMDGERVDPMDARSGLVVTRNSD